MQLPNDDDTDLQSGSAGANSIVEPFFMVQFADCQVSVQDPAHKVCLVLMSIQICSCSSVVNAELCFMCLLLHVCRGRCS